MEFFQRLKQCRIAHGLTQQQVAEEIGVDSTTYAHYETGRRTPDIKKLKQLCNLFGIAVQDGFPLVRNFEYPPEILTNLVAAKKRAADELAQLKSTRSSISPQELFYRTQNSIKQLQAAIEPAKDAWGEAMDTSDVGLNEAVVGQTVLRVNYRASDWKILSDSIELQGKLIALITQ